jgi:hypothetical protein
VSLPGGGAREISYDPLMRIKEIKGKDPGGNVILSRLYGFSVAGEITSIETEHGDYGYRYDDLKRLELVIKSSGEGESYGYDAIGNRIARGGLAGEWSYNPDNELISFASGSFVYDADGNMTEMISQLWDHQSEEWVNFRKWEMVLDYRTVTGIGENSIADISAVYRNPYRPGDVISFEGLDAGMYELQLFDINGRLTETREVTGNGQTAFYSDLNNGMYFMVLSGKKGAVYSSEVMVSR